MLNMLFWGFFAQIMIFAIAVAAIGWIVMLIIFKIAGVKGGDDEANYTN